MLGGLLVALMAHTASAETWRAQPFAEAALTLRAAIGEVRFGAVVTQGKPARLARVTLAVDDRNLDVPAVIYRDVVNPRVQETLALVPQDCAAAACDTPAAVMIRFYPALGDPKLPKTAACASSWLRIVFDRERVRRASVVQCLGSRHERERTVYPAAS